MKKLISPIYCSFLLAFFLSATALSAQTLYTPQQLQEEFLLIKKAYTSLHPGLYRYMTEAEAEAAFLKLKARLQQPRTRSELYKIYSEFLAGFRCGHTYCNFWNQPEEVKKEVFFQSDKLPFTFRLVDQRMIVLENVSGVNLLDRGAEITHIDGVAVPVVIDSLVKYVKGDGFKNHKRISDLQVFGTEEYAWFDIFYPLIFTPEDSVQLDGQNILSGEKFQVKIALTSAEARGKALQTIYGKKQLRADDLWKFEISDKSTAYLQMGDFTTWTMKMDWKKFLKDAFGQMKKEAIPNLIIDIRDNEGGADEVLLELSKYILKKKVVIPCEDDQLRYQKVTEDVRPYVSTWDNSIFDLSQRLVASDKGYFTWKKKNCKEVYPASPEAYQGQIYLLVNAANSSATFFLARNVKENKLGILVGEETGGNLNGITGGMMFFMTMPHSRIEMDIPLITNFPDQPKTDGGIIPDIPVRTNPADIVNGTDTCLEVVKSLIAKQLSE
ncbi:MAG: S41 family peptidase [Bacteroidia bacterium]